MTENKGACEGCGYWFELRSGLMACHYALVNGHTRTAVLGELPKPGRCRLFTRLPQRVRAENTVILKRRESAGV